MALILHYFTKFVYDVVVKQLLGLPRFQSLLLIVYDHRCLVLLSKDIRYAKNALSHFNVTSVVKGSHELHAKAPNRFSK